MILKHKHREINGYEGSEFETVVIDSPELVSKLKAGGFGEDMYSVRTVVGAELIPDNVTITKENSQ